MTTPNDDDYTDSDFLQDVIDIMEINGIEFPKSNPDK